ncbi:MAG: tRNA (adenosine(37)-N6)-threonylcarbamoyltransferase complex ATPase subunit type 1 TsaE [Saprospirales bacterium]|nr:MAG: tRNA (adenosine(37)-N6)-threonylcarbamoyltransferase complex ATPase subunit type 1 TsaE [Saprospirales bacterium]
MEDLIIISDLEELRAAMPRIVTKLGSPGLVFLYGEMGVGKTTFTAAFCEALGVDESISSPTFSLHNIYSDSDGREIYHLDLYRLESLGEFLDSGLEEALYHDHWVLIEWPQLAEKMAPPGFKRVLMESDESGNRIIRIL